MMYEFESDVFRCLFFVCSMQYAVCSIPSSVLRSGKVPVLDFLACTVLTVKEEEILRVQDRKKMLWTFAIEILFLYQL